MPVKTYKGAKAKADKLYSEIIRSVGYCEAEGWDGRPCSAQLQTAHICTRKRNATRTDLRNAFCLCGFHHQHFTDFPREFSRFITTTWAQEFYDALYQKSITPTKIDWDERVSFLKDIKEAMDEGELSLAEAREYEE